MEIFSNLALGFETALSLNNLFYCLIGVFLGTAVGVLPGLGHWPLKRALKPVREAVEGREAHKPLSAEPPKTFNLAHSFADT